MSLDSDKSLPVKTLGVLWLANVDMFTFKSQTSERLITPTKRSFLKLIATLFDPLGFLSPYIVRAKIIMQQIWIGGLDWDDILPEEITAKVMSWLSELLVLTKVRVPRCLQLGGEVVSVSLHVFVDASQDEGSSSAVNKYSPFRTNGSCEIRCICSRNTKH